MKPLVTTRSLSWPNSAELGKTTGKNHRETAGNTTGDFFSPERRTSAVEREDVFLTCCLFGGLLIYCGFNTQSTFNLSNHENKFLSMMEYRHDFPKKKQNENALVPGLDPLGKRCHLGSFACAKLPRFHHGACPQTAINRSV